MTENGACGIAVRTVEEWPCCRADDLITEKERERDRDRQTDRQTDRQKERHTKKIRDRE